MTRRKVYISAMSVLVAYILSFLFMRLFSHGEKFLDNRTGRTISIYYFMDPKHHYLGGGGPETLPETNAEYIFLEECIYIFYRPLVEIDSLLTGSMYGSVFESENIEDPSMFSTVRSESGKK